MEEKIFKKINRRSIREYQDWLGQLNLSPSTIKRRLSTLRKFCDWAQEETWLDQNPFLKTKKQILPTKRKKGYLSLPSIPYLSKAYKTYQNLPMTRYLHLGILMVFCAALGFGLYQQFFEKAPQPLAYPTSLTRPKRYLSFQGRLTDSSNNPITSSTNFTFKLWDHLTNSTEVGCDGGGDENCLWSSGICAIVPDQDGIFSTLLGSGCGTEIPADVFSENVEVWLGVKVDTDSEADPRIQIATVAYALNAETLQGYPPAAIALANTIPVVNTSGNIVIGATAPTIQGTSGILAIEGNAGLTLQTGSGSNGNIILAPDGTGVLNINLGGTTGSQMRITDANISSGSLISAYAGTDSTGFDLLNLSSGSTEATQFSVDESGNTYLAGNVGIGTTNPLQKLQVAGDINIESGSGVRINNTAASGEYLRGDGTRFVSSTIQEGDLPSISAAGGWTDDGGVVRLTTVGDSVGIGYADPGTAKLAINGNVGIGTTEPGGKLHTQTLATDGNHILDVYSSTTTDVPRLKFRRSLQDTVGFTKTTDQSYLGSLEFYGVNAGATAFTKGAEIRAIQSGSAGSSYVSGNILFLTSAGGVSAPAERMRIDSGGDVGIGNAASAPSRKLYVADSSDASLYLRKHTTNENDYSEILFGIATADRYQGAIRTYRGSAEQYGELAFFTQETSGAGYSSLSERMRVDSSGNVGIGTTDPNYKLDVDGNVNIGGSAIIGSIASVSDNNRVLTSSGEGSGTVEYIDTSSWDKDSDDDFGAWFLAGDTGTPQSIGSGETASIVGGIGIGTTASDTDTLTINVDEGYGFSWTGTHDYSAADIDFTNGTSTTLDITGDLHLDADGGDILFADNGVFLGGFSAGNFGIGTTGPISGLHLDSGTTSTITIEGNVADNSNLFGIIDFRNTDTTTYTGARIAARNYESADDGSLEFYGANAGSLSSQPSMTVLGNAVGIGTTAP
ncbi:MAG TPA: phage integrase SAM-like domain-containing protein, partial [Candidatus Bathyarchaeia archaeon]|nr:phage integrase SAM-like domain-containing protein [Candidatus Bathyarchaeia archaeon]